MSVDYIVPEKSRIFSRTVDIRKSSPAFIRRQKKNLNVSVGFASGVQMKQIVLIAGYFKLSNLSDVVLEFSIKGVNLRVI